MSAVAGASLGNVVVGLYGLWHNRPGDRSRDVPVSRLSTQGVSLLRIDQQLASAEHQHWLILGIGDPSQLAWPHQRDLRTCDRQTISKRGCGKQPDAGNNFGILFQTHPLVGHVRKEIGPIASPDVIHWAPGLPKTRSGKIMRRILASISNNADVGDVMTLANPDIVESIKKQVQS